MNNSLEPIGGDMQVQVFKTRLAMGEQAAADIAVAIRACQAASALPVRMVFAAAPSQQETLQALKVQPGIDWSRVIAFHMDEYVGLPQDAPQRFGNWLRRMFFSHLPFGEVHVLEPGDTAESVAQEADRYRGLLNQAPIDIVCMGIGVNGHLAFNDPPVADFHDPEDVKAVELDTVCRQQQVDDLCFAAFSEVPERALTLTLPRLLRSRQIFCMVPGVAKREAVTRTLNDPISTAVPATILRQHPDCRLYLDADSAPQGLAQA